LRLRYPIDIYKKIVERDSYGGEDIRYGLLSSEFADIEKQKGSEGEESSAQTAKRKAFFIIRYREDINEGDLITYKDERGENDYNITAINEYQKRGYKMYLVVEAMMANNIIKKQELTTVQPAILQEDGTPILNESYLEMYQG